MARPKKDKLSVRSKQLRIRLTEPEYYWLKNVAKRDNVDMSAELRECFRNYVNEHYSMNEFSELATRVVMNLKGEDIDGE